MEKSYPIAAPSPASSSVDGNPDLHNVLSEASPGSRASYTDSGRHYRAASGLRSPGRSAESASGSCLGQVDQVRELRHQTPHTESCGSSLVGARPSLPGAPGAEPSSCKALRPSRKQPEEAQGSHPDLISTMSSVASMLSELDFAIAAWVGQDSDAVSVDESAALIELKHELQIRSTEVLETTAIRTG